MNVFTSTKQGNVAAWWTNKTS